MNKKRGILLVVIALVVLSSFVYAREGYDVIDEKYKFLLKKGEMSDVLGSCCAGPDYDCARACRGSTLHKGGGFGKIGERLSATLSMENSIGFGGDCKDNAERRLDHFPDDKGCIIFFVDEDPLSGESDDGTIVYSRQESVINNDWISLASTGTSEEFCDDGGDGPNAAISDGRFKMPLEISTMCGDSSYWYSCEIAEDSTEILTPGYIWAGDNLYNCTVDEDDYPVWEKLGKDEDHDFYIDGDEVNSAEDCYYNALDDPDFCSEVETPNQCSLKVEYYQCAKCVNVGAPEVCGDGLGNGDTNDPTNGKGNDCSLQTSDDCNKNQESCEQKTDTTTYADGTEIVSIEHKNIFNEKFSWVKTGADDGFCCGFNGSSNLGKIVTDTKGEDYACLNKDPNSKLTGWSGDFPDGYCKESSGSWVSESWCLVGASGIPTSGGQWQIFTVMKPELTYDLVSNGQKWLPCNAEAEYLPAPEGTDSETDKNANRYYCYQEGNKFSWAECYGDTAAKNNDNIKGRYPGDAPYSLFIPNADDQGADYGISIFVDRARYTEFYNEESYFDFSDYDYLEFFVKFVKDETGTPIPVGEFNAPAEVKLEIFGPQQEGFENIVYFNKNVLGYTLPGAFFAENGWMHAKVPLPENLRGVTKLKFSSVPEAKIIGVKNIFLTKQDEQETKFCSGKDSTISSSWLDNLDQADKNNLITGKDLCTNHHGNNAWLGYDDDVDESWASCCGNGNNNGEAEFYFGESIANNGSEKYGCWNSQPIKSGETVMNINFEVKYDETTPSFTYPSEKVEVGITKYCVDEFPLVNETTEEISIDISNVKLGEKKFSEELNLVCQNNKLLSKAEIKTTNPEYIKVDFYNPQSGANLGTQVSEESFSKRELKQFVLLAVNNKVRKGSETVKEITENPVYSCLGEECLYPVPGTFPYKIKNNYPELYNLYFVNVDGEETLIGRDYALFNEQGNLVARNIAQQVLYSYDEEEAGFYGCNVADFISQIISENNLLYCSIKNDYFCAPSVTYEKEDGEKYTTISSWSKEPITKVGYENVPEVDKENFSEFYEQINLQLRDADFPPQLRNHTALILPARNMISNAQFEREKKQIPHWQFFRGDVLLGDDKEYYDRSESKITLTDTIKMRSEKIAISEETTLSLSYTGSAEVQVYLIDHNGFVTDQQSERGEFSTGFASFIVIEFYNGDVQEPMLQVVDEYGAIDYYYNNQFPRAGLACCPENFCWNGYACVEPMGEASALAEHVEEGRDYRCINGEWRNVPIRWDWNHQEQGFCSTTDQCFVLSSEYQASEENTAKQFYENKIPVCIEDKEYIFDHYCDKGTWTSRTKFLASKLLEVAASEDYKLYCTNYQDALNDYSLNEGYLGGSFSEETSDVSGLGEEISGTGDNRETIQTCYKLDGEAQRLIPEKENTCVNNVCVLEIDGRKVAFATTINKPINDTNSFLNTFNLPHQSITTNEICSGENGRYTECNFDQEGKLWYTDDIEGIVYGKDIALSSNWRDLQNWFLGLFGIESELSNEEKFINNAQNFRDVFILDKNGKKIRAVKEKFSDKKQTLIAEYENFNTPVCDYLESYKDAPPTPELGQELLDQLSRAGNVVCNEEENVQRVETVAALDFLWPQLTAKIRLED